MNSAIEERINWLYKKHGNVTADIVIEDAKNEQSPLHGEFEWDLEKAAMEAWRDKARAIIRSVRIVITTETKSIAVPRYIRTPGAESNVQSYSEVTKIRTQTDIKKEAMLYELGRLMSIAHRVYDLGIALGYADEVSVLVKNIEKIEAKIKD